MRRNADDSERRAGGGGALNVLINIDVGDLDKATRFYCDALGLRVGRRFDGAVELLGLNAPLYLLEKAAGTQPVPGPAKRDYARHWTPLHLDFEVEDLPLLPS